MINNRLDVLNNFARIALEVAEVNQKWHFNFDGTPKVRDNEFETRCILLMKSEIFEAFEAIRKGNQPDDKLPQFKAEYVELTDLFIRAVDFIVFSNDFEYYAGILRVLLDSEFDIGETTTMSFYSTLDTVLTAAYQDYEQIIAIMDLVIAYFDALQVPLIDIYRAKTDYNRNRKDHSVEARQAVGGKQF